MKTWSITEAEADARLDLFLLEQLGKLTEEVPSRSALQKQIKEGRVLVNGKSVTVHRFLKVGDEVTYTNEAPIIKHQISNVEQKPVRSAVKQGDLKILAETPDWLVIDKPSGLLVHPDAKTKEGTLVDLLLEHDPMIRKVGAHPDRPGIVHRLDREVSGLMVVAKTEAALEDLQRQFTERTISKTYLALVHGEMPLDEGDIKFRIARSATNARMAARPVNETGGRAAWTHYRVKERFVGATLLEVEILSGRTHQIRAHMHALGHPIIGDDLYKIRHTDRNVTAPRIMLQSVGLTFNDPTTGERKSFHLDPDPAFDQLIQEFRIS